MNIQKKKVERNREWSVSTQKKLASMLGVSAFLSGAVLSACDLGTNTTSGAVLPPETGASSERETLSSSSEQATLNSSSSSERSSSSLEPIMTPGVVPPDIDNSSSSAYQPNSSSAPVSGVSSSSYSIDTLEITSGEIAPPDTLEPESGSPFDQSHDLSSSSSIPPFPPQAGVVELDPESSSSSVDVLPSSSANEVEIDSTLTAGLPVLEESSSSAEPEPFPGDPIEIEPEPLSGVVAEPEVIYIDDPKD
ncbi:hypothetical protein [uncultured Fibrobacter sp.]|uniref:hypothetical protein n=1 Tax=uncultured Fibrobacter sp. TaxID=261512 RepID=UPI002613CC22|nr:hypothetical protein [uncultured Fibrobacter sp.]